MQDVSSIYQNDPNMKQIKITMMFADKADKTIVISAQTDNEAINMAGEQYPDAILFTL